MPAPRDWLTLTIPPLGDGRCAVAPGTRPFAAADAQALARLMLDSYRGSVDDGGETLDDARRDVGRLLAGDFGTVDWGACTVVERQGTLASATILPRDRAAPPPGATRDPGRGARPRSWTAGALWPPPPPPPAPAPRPRRSKRERRSWPSP